MSEVSTLEYDFLIVFVAIIISLFVWSQKGQLPLLMKPLQIMHHQGQTRGTGGGTFR